MMEDSDVKQSREATTGHNRNAMVGHSREAMTGISHGHKSVAT